MFYYIPESSFTISFIYLNVQILVYVLFQILLAAGDTFRAAASDQLEIWAERTGCEIVVAEKEKAKAASGRDRDQNLVFCFAF